MNKTVVMLSVAMIFTVSTQAAEDKAHEQWLKDKFSQQHQDIIPKVAVADMFYGCNSERKSDPIPYQIKDLVTRMDKTLLAEKLSNCLAQDSVTSEVALDFGLFACFHEQFSTLKPGEKAEKLARVKTLLTSLSKAEKHKSFTKCVTSQAINYLS